MQIGLRVFSKTREATGGEKAKRASREILASELLPFPDLGPQLDKSSCICQHDVENPGDLQKGVTVSRALPWDGHDCLHL